MSVTLLERLKWKVSDPRAGSDDVSFMEVDGVRQVTLKS
jgi:hypothetical protein